MYFQSLQPQQPLSIVEQYYETGMSEPSHRHVCYQLIIVKHGFIRVTTPNGQFAITQNRGIWLTQGTEPCVSHIPRFWVMAN